MVEYLIASNPFHLIKRAFNTYTAIFEVFLFAEIEDVIEIGGEAGFA